MKHLTNTPVKFIAVLLAIDIAFFTVTDPLKVTSAFLMVGFLLVVLTLYLVVTKLLGIVKLYGITLGKHQHRVALFITGVVGGLLALQSMGELSSRDAVVLVPLALVMYLYLSYGRPKAQAAKSLSATPL